MTKKMTLSPNQQSCLDSVEHTPYHCRAKGSRFVKTFEELEALKLVTGHRASIGEIDEHVRYTITDAGRMLVTKADLTKPGEAKAAS